MRDATAKQGHPRAPKIVLLEIKHVPDGAASSSDRQQVATLLGLPQDEVPPMHLTWCHLRRGPQGELLCRCPKVPSDLEAKVGYHVDNQNPSKKELVFGSVHLKTTDLNRALGLLRMMATAAEGERNRVLYWTACRIRDMAVAGEIDGPS